MDVITIILQVFTIIISATTLISATIINEKNRKKKNFIDVITRERLDNLGFLRKNFAELLALSFPDLLFRLTDSNEINEHKYKLALRVENIKSILCTIYREENELIVAASQILEVASDILNNKDSNQRNDLDELRRDFSKKTDIFNHAYWFFIIGQTQEDFKDTIKENAGDTFSPYFERSNRQYEERHYGGNK